MKYYNDIRELIGNTPLLRLNNIGIKESVKLFAKLELFNPGGSVKDRMGTALIEDAEKAGTLKEGYTILEATAGNAGIGIALAAMNKGYKIIFAIPEKFSREKLAIMKALGAEIIQTPLEKGMNGAFEKVQELLETIENSVCLSQFTNPANPKIHYYTTGPEIYRDLDGKIDYVVAGAGSGGTISGVLRYIKERNPKVKGILADPVGSTMGGGQPGCYSIEGIGNTFMPETMDNSLIDEVIKVNDSQALQEVKLVAKKEGLLTGTSSGAALYAARVISERVENANIVVIFPDRGDRYISKNIF
ncbi:MAG TPA: cysteine synthase family protein [Ruminiclostridium sp.]|nr:cysteine synthase family protein [Ruminiclostridium sp.]